MCPNYKRRAISAINFKSTKCQDKYSYRPLSLHRSVPTLAETSWPFLSRRLTGAEEAITGRPGGERPSEGTNTVPRRQVDRGGIGLYSGLASFPLPAYLFGDGDRGAELGARGVARRGCTGLVQTPRPHASHPKPPLTWEHTPCGCSAHLPSGPRFTQSRESPPSPPDSRAQGGECAPHVGPADMDDRLMHGGRMC